MSLKGSPARRGNRCKTNKELEVEVPGSTGGVGALRRVPLLALGSQKGFPEELIGDLGKELPRRRNSTRKDAEAGNRTASRGNCIQLGSMC